MAPSPPEVVQGAVWPFCGSQCAHRLHDLYKNSPLPVYRVQSPVMAYPLQTCIHIEMRKVGQTIDSFEAKVDPEDRLQYQLKESTNTNHTPIVDERPLRRPLTRTPIELTPHR